jgi:hypothetical protein
MTLPPDTNKDYWTGFLAGLKWYHAMLKQHGVPRDKEGVPVFWTQDPPPIERDSEDD